VLYWNICLASTLTPQQTSARPKRTTPTAVKTKPIVPATARSRFHLNKAYCPCDGALTLPPQQSLLSLRRRAHASTSTKPIVPATARSRFHLNDRMPSELGTFRRDEDKKKYVSGVIKGIGICRSVKAVSMDSYETLLAIVQNHPEADAKLRGIGDFRITKNKRGGQGFTLYIMKTGGGDPMDVSYNTSATGKGKSPRAVFLACLRVSIDPQIRKFKLNETMTQACTMCNKRFTADTGREADHVKHFVTIVDDFIAMQPTPFTYPTETRDCNDGTCQYRLTDADRELEDAFIVYHEKEATLRLTCKRCNQSRGNPKRPSTGAGHGGGSKRARR
jgi:hypothetical protein